MPCPRNLPRIIGLLGTLFSALFLLLTLPGCSAIRIGYNQLPDMGYWWIDSYVDLNEEQSVALRRDLALLHQWHRSNRLPLYADTLRQLRLLATKDISLPQACTLAQQLRGHLADLAAPSEALLTTLALSLGQVQLQHLQRQFDKRDDDWRSDWLDATPAAQRNKRFNQLLDRAELFYGKLDNGQKTVLRSAIDKSAFSAASMWTDRQRRQTDILQTLQNIVSQRPTPELARQSVHAVLERALSSPVAAQRSYFEQQVQEGCSTAARLHNATTPAQRQHAVEVLKTYEEDLRTLAAGAAG